MQIPEQQYLKMERHFARQRRRRAREAINRRNWIDALFAVNSEARLPLLQHMWPQIPGPDRPDALAEAVSAGDAPVRMIGFLYAALASVQAEGRRVFDGDAARKAYASLPDMITVHRGTVAAEDDGELYGVCWTLDRERALWCATQHRRFRNRCSPPIILQAAVSKDEICGLLFERDESEALLLPPQIERRIERHDLSFGNG
jgi:hypothetical protein